MVQTKILENGITLVVDYDENNPISTFGMLVKVGSENETKQTEGVAHFVEHLMFKSTKTRTTDEIASQVAYLGTENNAYTNRNHTLYYFKSLTENFEESFKIHADMLQNGVLEKSEVDSEREVVLEEIKRSGDNAIHLLFDQFYEHVYHGHPCSHPILGSEDVIKNISVEDIKKFINKHYVPENMIVSISGGISMQQAEDMVRQYYPNLFTKHAVPNLQDKTLYDVRVKEKYSVMQKDDKQVNILVSTKASGMQDADYYVQKLFVYIMGEDASSRLYTTLREKLGLAYDVSATQVARMDSGAFMMYIGTSKDKVSQALVGMRKILVEVAKNGVSETELQKAKNQIKARLLYQDESLQSIMMSNALDLFNKEQIETKQQYMEKIDKITVADIKRFAKRILLENEFLVCATGKDVTTKDLKVYETCMTKKQQTEQQQLQTQSQEEIEENKQNI